MSRQTEIQVLTAADVARCLSKIDVLKTMEETFLARAKGDVIQPAQVLTPFPEDSGDFITYSGVLGHLKVFGSKMSPYLPTSAAPIVTAWTTLMSMESGQPLLLCDSGLLTQQRTAAVTALAIDRLAPNESKTLALIGSGPLAMAHLNYVLTLREWESVRVYSPSLSQNGLKQATFLSLDSRILITNSAEECVEQADVVMLCTSSAAPVFNFNDIGKTALITSISTNAAKAHEIDPACLPDMDVYCDDKISTPSSAGEMLLAAERHHWSADRIKGDLADLVSQQCQKPDYQRSVFFRSIGLGIEDIAIAYAVYQQSITE